MVADALEETREGHFKFRVGEDVDRCGLQVPAPNEGRAGCPREAGPGEGDLLPHRDGRLVDAGNRRGKDRGDE